MNTGHLQMLTRSGARIHQAGCNGCIGMGQAPATGQISLRTVPRNFPGRSGTKEDAVYLVSPETAAASALTGEITDPRDLEDIFGMSYPHVKEPDDIIINTDQLVEPPSEEESKDVELEKGPNVVSLPEFDPLPSEMTLPVLLKLGDDISTDEIMPAGSRILPYRSNIPKISEFVFEQVDERFFERSQEVDDTGHAIVAGTNYGQGSSREHAAIAPRWLGTRVKLVKSFARIHRQNLANFGILPLTFQNEADYDDIDQGDELQFTNLREQIKSGHEVEVRNVTKDTTFTMEHDLSERELEMVLSGSQISVVKKEFAQA
jgi:aconitate hydratase